MHRSRSTIERQTNRLGAPFLCIPRLLANSSVTNQLGKSVQSGMKGSGYYTCNLMRMTKPVSLCTWGGQRGAVRRADGYRPQDFFQVQVEAITSAVTAELNEKYNALQEQKRQASHSSRHTQPKSEADDDMNGGFRPAVRPPRPKGEGRGANTRQ